MKIAMIITPDKKLYFTHEYDRTSLIKFKKNLKKDRVWFKNDIMKVHLVEMTDQAYKEIPATVTSGRLFK